MEYKIVIDYRTGDSFKNEDVIETLDLTWTLLDVAKENLQFIKEHYIQYQNLNDYNYGKLKKTREETYDLNKEWFVNEPVLFSIKNNNLITEKDKKRLGDGNWEYRPDPHLAEICLYLKTDTGKKMRMKAFWCGYFEQLYSAEIEIDKTNLRIEF